MKISKLFRPIRTEKEYQKALEIIDRHFDAKAGTLWGNVVEVLSILVEVYEDEHYPMNDPDPIEAIKFRMDQLGMAPRDLTQILGQKSHVSEILSGKRDLSLNMIRKLHAVLGIPAELLIQQT